MNTETKLPTGKEKRDMVQTMFDDIAPTYETTNKVITFGLDTYARKVALKSLRAKPKSLIIDLASGTGDFARMLENLDINVLACDLSFGMLSNARDIENRIQSDVTSLPFQDESVDGLVCGYALRNFVDLKEAFSESMRVIKTGGRFVAVDVSVPKNPLIKYFNRLWFGIVVPKIGWVLSKNKQAYEYLPKSTSYLPSNEKIKEFLENAGGENVSVKPIIFGSVIIVSATKQQPMR